ncbi:DNA-3-methyladenine glycosylase family protein [Brytella acorum]|uniref:DNA-3-methyladenine glycosylase II n=1 Tax=Brytella acorum TaxID=2959299 RepID=A0AA35Y2V7_9PROT|nr:DNA-3-methyladenine glycosylase 2 family protein [Brytella acorum]CAI9120217.1 DNA-3-methyladenine glycosylase 2 family protein [Brytella acorum]
MFPKAAGLSHTRPSPFPEIHNVSDTLGIDPDIADVIKRIGPCRLRGQDGATPYQALLRAITGQQLHGRAAEAILGRFKALSDGDFPPPEVLLSYPDPTLRACGLSAAKILAMRGVAQARLDGIVPGREEAARLTDEELIARLITLRGVGRWTVQMILMFTLGRPDVMPIDDFGVRAGWKTVKKLHVPPTPKTLAAATERFAPHRSALAWYLWRVAGEGRNWANPLTGDVSASPPTSP